MCGILGHFAFGDRRPDAELWCRLVNLLAHRGPDDSTFWHDGRFAFGHRRLSIIDLADGRQPMATDDGALVVTFNGEIYNYVELRNELAGRGYRFQTRSDTEVLLHGYHAWGTGLPARLRGMFAFALADRRTGELFVARDRFGEKPFLFTEDANGLSFGSELKVLAALPTMQRTIDETALTGYLCLNYVPGTATLMRGVRRLAPATWRLWTADGTSRSGRYWTPPSRDDRLALGEADALERASELLDTSAGLALRSDVPVGVFLSGGVDSTLVVQSAARAGRLASAYCLTFADASYSEWPRAAQTARRLGIPLQEVRLEPEALEDFLALVEHADEPLADSSSLAVWALSRETARHVKVALSGDGGDELFAGYLTYPATLWHTRWTTRLPFGVRRAIARAGGRLGTSERKVSFTYKLRRFLRAADLAAPVAHLTWNGTWLPEEAAAIVAPRLRPEARWALTAVVENHALPAKPTLRDLQAIDTAEYLPNDILAKSDRMSMAHGLEVRAPFLDADLATFALRLPDRLKLGARGRPKALLRALARRRGCDDIARAPKQGFSIPVHAWLRTRARPLVDDLLSRDSLAAIPVLDADGVMRAVTDHMSGRRSYGFELWGLAVLVAWHRAFVQRPVAIPRGPLPRAVVVGPTGHTSTPAAGLR